MSSVVDLDGRLRHERKAERRPSPMNSWSSLAEPARSTEFRVETLGPVSSINFPSELTGRFGWGTAESGYLPSSLSERRFAAIRLEPPSVRVLIQYADKT